MLAFTHSTVPKIMESIDFLNIMTYDLMNRRDNVTKHHTSAELSLEAVIAYLNRGLTPYKANLGLAFYVKWFKTARGVHCHERPIGCKTELMEDPETGADLGQAGAFSWHDQIPDELSRSFAKALAHGAYDKKGGGHCFWDEAERLFWSWDTPDAIRRKLAPGSVLEEKKLGGVFAWGLGEDAPKFDHLRAANAALGVLSASRSNKDRSEL
jgi:GH18 family chitinase